MFKVTNKCNCIIPKGKKWAVSYQNPKPPQIKVFKKLHKTGNPIRPVINFQHAPAYKVAQFFTKFFNNTFQLPYTFNVRNSAELTADLNDIDINADIRLCSFDINNTYPNIPTLELTNIITEMANLNNFPLEVTNEIITLTELITKQNYFEMNSKFYIQSEGLAMGAPSSAILSGTYLQYIEHIHIIDLLNRHKIISYHRYVDDILIVYNTLHTNINCVLGDFNNIHRKIQFGMEEECNNHINFLDLTIVRTGNRLEVGIFRKPTATDIMMNHAILSNIR
jgi:hypothetical protein